MKETIYTQTLKRAADAEGGSAALAGLLRVPQNTLERWMSGRAQTPVRAFLKALERLTHHESTGAAAPLPAPNGEPLVFRMGQLLGRCQRCDGTQFDAADPAAPVKLTSPLRCRACGAHVIHGTLISQLAQDAVLYAHAMTAARTRRQALGRQPAARKKDLAS
jgi:hypothetical protein